MVAPAAEVPAGAPPAVDSADGRPSAAAAEPPAATADGTTADGAAVNGSGAPTAGAEAEAEADPGATAGEDEALCTRGSGEEINYGLAVDPEEAFDMARAAVRQLHLCLDRLLAGKAAEVADGAEAFAATARTMQLQLLALRRAHRAMAKAADAGRMVEGSARRKADTAHAHLETRIYESRCCRAAARRCRNFQTPQLNKLRPLLEGGASEEDEDMEDGEEGEVMESGTAAQGLAAHLEAERSKRASLFVELESLERQKAKDLEAFREVSKISDELTVRLRAVEHGMEPVCDLLQHCPQPNGMVKPDGLAALPLPLQLVFTKFDVLASSRSAGGITVRAHVGGGGELPPGKRPRLEAGGTAAELLGSMVCVELLCTGGSKVLLRFACPHHALVTVAAEGLAGRDGLLEGLWHEDDSRQAGLAAMLPAGMPPGQGWPYGWAQILAGLRETLLTEAPALEKADGVTAADVVHRVRARVAKRPKA